MRKKREVNASLPKMKKITRKFLIKEYIKNKKNCSQIAKQINCGEVTIWRALNKFQIKTRTSSEALKLILDTEEYRQSASKRILGKLNPNFKHGETLKKHFCIDCGNEIYYKSIRCSNCWGIFNSGTNHYLFKGEGNRTCDKIDYCSKCKKEITVGSKSGYCKSCSHKGKLNISYIDGHCYDPYPSEFNKQLKESIRDRDGHKCQYCGKTEEHERQELNKVLSIHHIDYDKTNCKETNLISLCQTCNITVNANRDYYFAFFTEVINCLLVL